MAGSVAAVGLAADAVILSALALVGALGLAFWQPAALFIGWAASGLFLDRWIEVPMGVGSPDLSFSRFTLLVLILAIVLRRARRWRELRLGPVELSAALLMLGFVAAAPLSVRPDPRGVVQTGFTLYLVPVIAYFLAKHLIGSRRDYLRLVGALTVLGVGVAVSVILEYSTGWVLFPSQSAAFGTADLLRAGDTDLPTVRGLLGGPGNLGRVLAATILTSTYLLLEASRGRWTRAWIAGAVAIQVVGTLLTLSRSPWLGLGIGFAVLGLAHPRGRRPVALSLASLLVLILLASEVAPIQKLLRRVEESPTSLQKRSYRWIAGYNMWKEKPVRGWGFGRYEEKSIEFKSPRDPRKQGYRAIENDYLHILVGAGVVGFVPYLVVLLAPFVGSLILFSRARAPDPVGVGLPELSLYWALLAALILTSFFAIHVHPTMRIIVFTLAGATVGSQRIQWRWSGRRTEERRPSRHGETLEGQDAGSSISIQSD